jgi:signal transduction histidine kinase
MPHGCCYLWQPGIIWLHVLSDAFIAAAYYSIPVTLVYFVRRRHDLAFDWIFLCFAAFIVLCGTTHLMEIVNIWHPVYWLSGIIKAITALASVFTAVLLVRLIPRALALPSPEQLRVANNLLQSEVKERTFAVNRIEALNSELSAQATKLEAANQELEAFGYSVSHDLRAPLRHIDGYIELLRHETSASLEIRQRYMDLITGLARQMAQLIDSLLAFSRMGRAALRPSWIEANATVNEVRESLFTDTQDRLIDWKIDPLPKIFVDEGLFRQVWFNLLSNAVKYTNRRERAEIAIHCRETKHEFEFSIEDNGAGFDMKYSDKLFGIFQRLHLKDEFEGTGIGLANVRRIVARHGGRVWAEGCVDQGATFYFAIPKTGSA